MLNLLIKLGRTDILAILSLPVHKHVLSLHLFTFSFISSEIRGFLHIDITHIWLDLYVSILFFDAKVNYIVFLISNSSFLLVYRKTVDFGMLTLYSATLL